MVHLEEKKSKFNLREHELTREFIFLYAMSMLARYKVNEWDKHMSGSAILWELQNCITATQMLFPNLIFNQLHGSQFYFYPSQPTFMTVTELRNVSVSPEWIF